MKRYGLVSWNTACNCHPEYEYGIQEVKDGNFYSSEEVKEFLNLLIEFKRTCYCGGCQTCIEESAVQKHLEKIKTQIKELDEVKPI